MKKKFWMPVLAVVLSLPLMLFAACVETPAPGPGPNDDPETEEPSMDDYNLIDYTADYGYFGYNQCFKASNTMTFRPSRGLQIYEAEQATLGGDAAPWGEALDRVGWLTENSSVTYNIESTQDCTALVVLNTSTSTDDWDGAPADDWMTVTVNGTKADTSDCWIYGTGALESYYANNVCEIEMKKGSNIVAITSLADQAFNLDWMVLMPKISQIEYSPVAYDGTQTVRIEAEDANGQLCDCVISDLAGFSGGKVIDWTAATTRVEFLVDAAEDCTVNLVLKANFGGQVKALENRINVDISDDFDVQYLDLSGIEVDLHDDVEWWTYTEDSYDLGTVTLKKGTNSIRISAIIDVFNLDCIDLVPVAA